MALPDFPLPAELAVESEPLTDDDLALYFGVMDAGPNAELRPDGSADPEMAAQVEEAGMVHAWRIEADDQAEWALRKLALANEELRRLQEQAQEWASRIQAWFDQASRQPQRTAGFMTERLEDYALRLRQAGGPATLQLPSGTIKTTERKPAVEVENDALLAGYLEERLGEPPRALDEAELARFRAWRSAWEKACEGLEEPLELVKHTPKVYAGPLRKLVRLGDVPDGVAVRVLLACEHVQEWHTESVEDQGIPDRGEIVPCLECPADVIEGEARQPVALVTMELVRRPAAIGPDGEEVPGAGVKAGGIVPKVEAR